jgi:hypothetical protein
MTFPADHELLAFFGAEPKILDPGVPWFYNTLDFEVERHGFLVQCRLAPSYGELNLRLQFGGKETTRLHVTGLKSLVLVMNAAGEALVATVDRGHRDETFGLMLEPNVWVGLGVFQRIPPEP